MLMKFNNIKLELKENSFLREKCKKQKLSYIDNCTKTYGSLMINNGSVANTVLIVYLYNIYQILNNEKYS